MLVLRNVVKVREQGNSHFELSVPNLAINAGEFIAVVGESGCGKSTLLDLLALISSPTSAERYRASFPESNFQDIAQLWKTGNERALAEIRLKHLGYVLQTGGLLPYLTVLDNLMLPLRLNHIADARERVEQMAERMGVGDCLGRLPETLSGGQRQRVAILRALSHRPSIVLADEPTAAVDKKRAELIVRDFRILARDEGLSIVMVTHDWHLVENIADSSYGFDVSQISDSHIRSICHKLQ